MGEKGGVPHYNLPAFPSAGVGVTTGATANVLSANYVSIGATTAASYITGVGVAAALTTGVLPLYCGMVLATGTSTTNAVIVDQAYIPIHYVGAATISQRVGMYYPVFPPVSAAATSNIYAKTASDVVSVPWVVWLEVIAQTGLVDDGVNESSNVTQLLGTASQGVAGYAAIDWSHINAPTTAQGLTGTTISAAQTVATVTGNVAGNVTGSVGSVAGNVVGSVGSVVNQVSVSANTDKTGYSLTQAFPTNFSALAITATGAVTVGTNLDKTGYAAVANVTSIAGATAAVPGAAGGILIAGTNAATTFASVGVSGATTYTGNVAMQGGLTVTQSTLNAAGVSITGNGTGDGMDIFSGTGATGDALQLTSQSTVGSGLRAIGTGGGDGFHLKGGASADGDALHLEAGGASGFDINLKSGVIGSTTGVPTFTSLTITSGLITNITGNLSGSVGSVTNQVAVSANADKTGYSLTQAFPGNFSALAITAGGAVTVGTNSDKTGYSLTQAFPSNFSSLAIDGSGNVSTSSNIKKNTAQANFMFIMTDSTTHIPTPGLTVTAQRSLDGAAFAPCANTATGVGNGTYVINLAATDTNANHVMLMFTAAGADQLNIEIVTVP